MSRPETSGFQKPIDDGKRREVRVAIIHYTEDGFAVCSCKQPFTQRRQKPREDAIDKHIAKKHSGQGVRL